MWKCLSNQFLIVGERSYKKALILNNYHIEALQKANSLAPDDEDIKKILDRYAPLSEKLISSYTTWKNMGGISEAHTLNFDQLLATLQTKINLWEPAIQNKFAKTSAEFKAILPNGRSGLTRGSKEERLQALKNLSKSLTGIEYLTNIKKEVDSFYKQLEAANIKQPSNKSGKNKSSNAMAKAVTEAMEMQYRNLGLLIDKFITAPALIETFFDLKTLQEATQTSFTGTLEPSENEAVLVHRFISGDELNFKVTGNNAARFYLSNIPNGVNSEMVQVTPGAKVTIDVVEFSVPDLATYQHLTAVNPSNTDTLKYEVEVL